VHVGRIADEKPDVTLYRQGEIPDGFVQIPAGAYLCQGDKENPYSGPRVLRETHDYLMAKYPVTCREYLEFLNELADKDPKQAARRVPREYESSGYYWPKQENGKYVIPTASWLTRTREELKKKARRLATCSVDWEEDWPVYGVSWEDMMAYAAWRREISGQLFTLPHESHWEKSARGTDGRPYPWGHGVDATFCNMGKSHEGGSRPCVVASYPTDESLYGVKGLAGNLHEWCLAVTDEKLPGSRVVRGGSWRQFGVALRSSSRWGVPKTKCSCFSGGRLLCVLRCRTQPLNLEIARA
jgi:serine/threonine-protein kinase